MTPADVFIRNVTGEQLAAVVEEYLDHFIGRPVPLWTDNGTEEEPDPELLGYHAKVTSRFYRKAKIRYPAKIHLYQNVVDQISKTGAPPHVFGPGGCIETQIDPDGDEDTVCRFHIGKAYAVSTDRRKAFKIDSGAIREMTPQEIFMESVQLETDPA